ncbi:hypothetical protein ACJ73_02267 [Blastomyces percursus]|uniref:Uncharacterized protein n=1 Tax=Blastomyces percursus TaxID=1658174 RepID=A0A1J9QD03_9EURO|nr:hypothetical protein ACJ73_02267 [Blastomyces percursus]
MEKWETERREVVATDDRKRASSPAEEAGAREQSGTNGGALLMLGGWDLDAFGMEEPGLGVWGTGRRQTTGSLGARGIARAGEETQARCGGRVGRDGDGDGDGDARQSSRVLEVVSSWEELRKYGDLRARRLRTGGGT